MARRILLVVALAAALVAGQATGSLAITTYAAQVSSILTITGFLDGTGAPIAKPLDLVVEGDAEVFDLFESALGDASADTLVSVDVFGADPLDLDVGEGTVLSAGASGGTSFPPASSAESFARTDALIFFDNLSATETYQVAFELTVNWFAHASADLPATEVAEAGVQIVLASLSGGTLFDVLESSNSTLGGGPVSDSQVLESVLVLGPGEFDELDLISDAVGKASSVPEPSSLLLVGSGLFYLLARRRGSPHRSRRLV